jgi:hypothetical protein
MNDAPWADDESVLNYVLNSSGKLIWSDVILHDMGKLE